MLIYCVKKWEENKDKLKEAFEKCENRYLLGYDDIIKMIVEHIFNRGRYGNDISWNDSDIHIIDDGDYQGTLLVLIHVDLYQPSADDYIMGFIEYGSCSGCDALQSIQSTDNGQDVSDYMNLCLDIIQSFKHPFRAGWRCSEDDLLSEIEYKSEE